MGVADAVGVTLGAADGFGVAVGTGVREGVAGSVGVCVEVARGGDAVLDTEIGALVGTETDTDAGEAVPMGRPNAMFWAICAWVAETNCHEAGVGTIVGLDDEVVAVPVMVGVGGEAGVVDPIDADVGVAVGVWVVGGTCVAAGVCVGADVADPGAVTALAINVTAVCASALPFSFAPLFITIAVWDNIIPLTSDVVPSVACPATDQKMFLACAPPLRITLTPLPTLRVCAI